MAKAQDEKAEVGTGKIDDIRNILFGNNIAEYNKRFSTIEQKLVDEVSLTREDNLKRIETLEKYLKNEIDSLVSDLNQEKEERVAGLQKMAEEIKEFKKTFSEFEKETNKNLREIRASVLALSNELDNKISREIQNLRTLLISNVEQLEESKVNRINLAALFSDIAIKLGGQTDNSDKE